MNNIDVFLESIPSYYREKAKVAYEYLIKSGYSENLTTQTIAKKIATSVKLDFKEEALVKAIELSKRRNMRGVVFVLFNYTKIWRDYA